MTRPPRSERIASPDAEAVAALASGLVGPVWSLRRPSGGTDGDAWLVNNEAVLRLARDADLTRRQEVEHRLRERLRPRLGTMGPRTLARGAWASVARASVRSAIQPGISGMGVSKMTASPMQVMHGDITGRTCPAGTTSTRPAPSHASQQNIHDTFLI